MAYEKPVLQMSHEAAADLSAKQFRFVKLATGGKVDVCAAATDKPYGVLQNAPTAGQTAIVCVIGCTKVDSDAALAVGVLIGTSGDGQADAKTPGTDTTEYTVGQVIEASGAAGELATAVVNCAAPCRAA